MNAGVFQAQSSRLLASSTNNGMTTEKGSIILAGAGGGAVYDTAKDHPPPAPPGGYELPGYAQTQFTSFGAANPLLAGMPPEYFNDYSPMDNQPRYWKPSASFFAPTDYKADNGFAVTSNYTGAQGIRKPCSGSFGGFVTSNGAGPFIPYSYAMQQSVGADLTGVPSNIQEAQSTPSATEAMLDPRLLQNDTGNANTGTRRNVLLMYKDRPVSLTVNYLQKMITQKYAGDTTPYVLPAAQTSALAASSGGDGMLTGFARLPGARNSTQQNVGVMSTR